MRGREQRHPVFPSHVVSAPEDYPEPGPGAVTTWRLRTPRGEPVGTLEFNEGGVSWSPASGVSVDAQEHAAELLQYLRGHRAEGIALEDALGGVRAAYAGDLDES